MPFPHRVPIGNRLMVLYLLIQIHAIIIYLLSSLIKVHFQRLLYRFSYNHFMFLFFKYESFYYIQNKTKSISICFSTQINTKCSRNTDTEGLQCRNVTSSIEYRIESSLKWFKLADMADLTCRTSLINGGYFNIHTIKLPLETYSRYEKILIKI